MLTNDDKMKYDSYNNAVDSCLENSFFFLFYLRAIDAANITSSCMLLFGLLVVR